MKILFWLLVAIDTLVLGAWFVLGLAFAGPSQTYTARVVQHFLLPFGLLVAAAALFLFAKSPLPRGVAFALALSPVLVVYLSFERTKARPELHWDAEGNFHDHIEGPERELDHAIKANDVEAVRAALRKADVNKAGSSGMTPLTKAMDKLLENGVDVTVMRELLAAGARASGTSESAVSPLARAIEMTKRQGTEPMMLLLKAGAKPNAKMLLGDPAFFAAAEKGIDVSVIQTLVEHGADLRMVDGQGKNVLDCAIFSENQPVERYLLQQGLKPEARR